MQVKENEQDGQGIRRGLVCAITTTIVLFLGIFTAANLFTDLTVLHAFIGSAIAAVVLGIGSVVAFIVADVVASYVLKNAFMQGKENEQDGQSIQRGLVFAITATIVLFLGIFTAANLFTDLTVLNAFIGSVIAAVVLGFGCVGAVIVADIVASYVLTKMK